MASPVPTAIRAVAIWAKLLLKPKPIEAKDQKIWPIMTRIRRLMRSTSQPMGSPAMIYKTANAGPMRNPICESEIPISLLMSSTRRERMLRSRKELM